MSFLVPDKIIAAEGEKTLRQYRCAKLSSASGGSQLDATIAVTNRRVILYADSANKKNQTVYQNETFIDNITGISFFKGTVKIARRIATYVVLFLLAATIGGILFWQAEKVHAFLKLTMALDLKVKLLFVAAPIVLYAIIALLTTLRKATQTMQLIIHTRGFASSNVALGVQEDRNISVFNVKPNNKETKRMISEVSSIILDIQKYGSENVLKHIDADI